ncbi:bacteriohemerythrin [Geomesophilobacter sediminis]|uniref:Hemerythrin family protein n=1 Tax=Geomesophilobacter sediminis TaxID=2798584 RepID=A0A8J7IN81_9BACT|nr:hemerythrin family protein [Geomesophilobacter sediminis]MBJ6724563.1 hemerythrin family protein [Geomesophilobacter sediminis]
MDSNEEYRTALMQFEEHHDHLVEQLNSAFNLLVVGASIQTVENVLDDLVDYATFHFAYEDAWLAKHGYPRNEHRMECVRFAESLSDIRKEYTGGRKPIVEILTFVKKWVTAHIASPYPLPAPR